MASQSINPFPSLQSPVTDPRTGICTDAWYRLFLRLAHQDMAGEVFLSAAGAPQSALLCNGAAVSRTTYSALFSAIGTTFGPGDGVTTFNIPNIPAVVANVRYYIHY